MKNWLLSFIYALLRFSLGLLLHPHQTMQILVSQKLFIWVTFLPTILLSCLVIVWRLIIMPGLAVLTAALNRALLLPLLPKLGAFSCPTLSTLPWAESLSFLSIWIIIFVVYWQIMLIYLLIRFSLALKIT